MSGAAEGTRGVLVDLSPASGPTTGGPATGGPAAMVWADEFGVEVAQILRRAHDAVQAMGADGRLQMSRLRVEAQQQLVRLRADAERYAEVVREEAEAYAARLRAEAERYALETREQARLTAEAHLRLNEQLLACWSGLARQAEGAAAPVRSPELPRRRAVRGQPAYDGPVAEVGRPFFAPLIEGDAGPAVA